MVGSNFLTSTYCKTKAQNHIYFLTQREDSALVSVQNGAGDSLIRPEEDVSVVISRHQLTLGSETAQKTKVTLGHSTVYGHFGICRYVSRLVYFNPLKSFILAYFNGLKSLILAHFNTLKSLIPQDLYQ